MTETALTESEALEAVQRIMAEVLGAGNVDPGASFHQLGGDSLRALKVAGRIAFEFDTAAAVDGSVLEALLDGVTAEALTRMLVDSLADDAVAVEATPVSRELSFGEERLWMAHEYQRERSTYHTVGGFRVVGALDLDILDRAVTALVARHPALRTRYAADRPAVEPATPVVAPVDIIHHRALMPWAQAEQLAEEDIQVPFDLTAGRLLRLRTYRTGEREWLLQFVFHHIAIDGWSMDIIYRELAALYAGTDPGRGETADYRDFAHWQRIGAGVEAEAEDWAQRLLPLPDRIDLGDGRRRTPTRNLEGTVLYTDLPPEITAKLTGLATAARTSLFVVLLAILHVSLARRTGRWEALIGTVVAGRSRPQDHETVGYFTNTVPVRVGATPDSTLQDLIAVLRDEWRYVFTHQGVPLEELAVRTRRAPDPSRTPLIDVVMVLQNNDDVPLMLDDCVAEPLWMHTGTSKFDLMLEAIAVSGILHLSWEYATQVLTAEETADIAAGFERITRALPEDGAVTLRELVRPDPAELGLLREVNTPVTAGAANLGVCAAFEAVATRQPDAVALHEPGRRSSFQDLAHMRDRIRTCLRRYGIGPGDVVAVDAEISALSLAATLATWSLGAVVAMIDRTRTEPAPADQIRACGVSAIVGEMSEAVASGPAVITAEDVAAVAESPGTPAHRSSGDPAWLAAVTDGTRTVRVVTGTHRAILEHWAWESETFPGTAGEVVVTAAAHARFGTVTAAFAPLLAGAALAPLPLSAVFDAAELTGWVRRCEATRLRVTPSMMWTVLHTVPDASTALATVRVCVFGGETLDTDLLARARESMPECRLINIYGASAVTTDAAWADVTTRSGPADVPIGSPIGSARIFAVDDAGEPVPTGVIGDLVIAGPPVGTGPDCDSRHHTGDLGWLTHNGQFVSAGPPNREVRVRGSRVELSYVERILREADGVSAAVAWSEPSPAGDRVLAAVVPQRGERLSGDDVRSTVQYRIPSYMVPSRVTVLDTLPLRPDGTLDRTMVAVRSARDETDWAQEADEISSEERRMQKIWSDVLHGELAAPEDNFFALGGDSLAVTTMLTAVLREFGVELGLAQFLLRPTLRGAAEHVAVHGATA
ncbi:condensation domain-containing protein [Nocardia sp. NPDC020380]|uniref:condensation domain-containing protein n=1 Tax=Nocardia sp. NPDC020380 TaxID=3364309 RepID=UPI0037AB977E